MNTRQRIMPIIVEGQGTDPNHRSHWAFAVSEPGATTGVMMQVTSLDLQSLTYHFDSRTDVDLRGPGSEGSEGSFEVARLSPEDAKRAREIIAKEPPPRDGIERCQDWVLRTVIALEAEELVLLGTSEWVSSLVGETAAQVEEAVGWRWTATLYRA